MINTILTIIIPCKNSVVSLKKTVEDIIKKTKVNNTRLIIIDFGSTDGSYQYAAQASSEHIRSVKIESVKMEDKNNIKDCLDLIDTPYVLVITPGSTFKDPDIFIRSVNEINKIEYPIAYLKRTDIINNIMSTFLKKKRIINAIFSKKEFLNILEYRHEDLVHEIHLQDLSKGIKVGGFTD